MAEPEQRRVAIGVWAALDRPVDFVSEGMTRLLGFLVEGAARSGRVTLHVCVLPVNEGSARAMLEGLRAREGQDWTLQLIGQSPDTNASATPAAAPLPYSERTVGRALFLLGVAFAPLGALRTFARWLLRPFWRHGLRLATASLTDPVGNAPEVAVGLRRLRLPVFRRFANRLDAWASERTRVPDPLPEVDRPPAPAPRGEGPKLVGPSGVSVDVWLSLFPNQVVPDEMQGRRALIFPDALLLDFGGNWPPEELRSDGVIARWFTEVRANLERAESVITFSRHVAARHAVAGLGVDPARIAIVPHAPPDLAYLLPFIAPDRRRTEGSRHASAEMLRKHVTKEFARLPRRIPEGMGFERARADSRRLRYLTNFPFEHVNYVAVSTRERPSKNFAAPIEALRILLQERFVDVKLVTTGRLVTPQDDSTASLAFNLVSEHGMMLDVLEMADLPNPEHAGFYHSATITVHPAFFEGGNAPFPFSESVSVGTPCLMARGPHTEEMLEDYPELEPFVFDPFDAEALADRMLHGILERDAILEVQLAAYERMRARTWAQVAEEYAAAAAGVPLVPVRRLTPLALPRGAG